MNELDVFANYKPLIFKYLNHYPFLLKANG